MALKSQTRDCSAGSASISVATRSASLLTNPALNSLATCLSTAEACLASKLLLTRTSAGTAAGVGVGTAAAGTVAAGTAAGSGAATASAAGAEAAAAANRPDISPARASIATSSGSTPGAPPRVASIYKGGLTTA